MKKIRYEVLCEIPTTQKSDKYYYFYKIVNEVNGKYYYGVHSTKNLNDGYQGSSKRLKKDIKDIGLSSFKKYILKFFKTSGEMYEYEGNVVTKNVVLEDCCYNMHTGGSGSWDFTIGRVCVKDISGNTMMVDKNDEDYRSGKLVSNMLGLIHVRTENGETKTIPREEYYANKNKYSALISGYVLAKNAEGVDKWVKKDEFVEKKKKGELVGHTKNMGVFRNSSGETMMCSLNDERVLSGELVGATKGVGVYKYKNDFSKIVATTKDDERVKKGELVGLNYGMVYCINPVTKETITVKKGDERLKNGELITWTKYLYQIGRKKGNGKSSMTIEYYEKKYPLAMDGIKRGDKCADIAAKTGLTTKKVRYLRGRYNLLNRFSDKTSETGEQ